MLKYTDKIFIVNLKNEDHQNHEKIINTLKSLVPQD